MKVPAPSIRFASDRSLLISWPGPASIEVNHWVHKLFRLISASDWKIENMHPAYSSLLVDLAAETPPEEFLASIRKLCDGLVYGEVPDGNLVELPVVYDGADLAEVARETGMTTEQVIQMHSETEYRVAFLGFSPGFPYLIGLREKLFCRRKSTPRLKVPAGSVAIAGFQTGIYPHESPGGWQLLGRTSEILFDPQRAKPSLLSPGDRVRFRPAGEVQMPTEPARRESHWPGHALCEVLRPGPLTTIQDHGRLNQSHLGVARGGAADPFAFSVGNSILGNPRSAAGLEMTAAGPSLRFNADAWVCLTGAETEARLEGNPVGMWTAFHISAGQLLELGALRGFRSYLCVRGGLAAPEILGSRSTFVSGGWGGLEGRAVKPGDVLHTETGLGAGPVFHGRALTLRRMYSEDVRVLRVMRGPHWDLFSDQARELFFSSDYEVTLEANRLGLRLNGAQLELAAGQRDTEMLSEGIANGAVQVPLSGQPLILFCEQNHHRGLSENRQHYSRGFSPARAT
jgi:KipI family sensor histidine kinase inhibitor